MYILYRIASLRLELHHFPGHVQPVCDAQRTNVSKLETSIPFAGDLRFPSFLIYFYVLVTSNVISGRAPIYSAAPLGNQAVSIMT